MEELTNNVFSQSYFCTSLNFKGCTALKTIGNRAFLNLGKYMGDGKNGVEQTEAELDLTPCTALETIDVSGMEIGVHLCPGPCVSRISSPLT